MQDPNDNPTSPPSDSMPAVLPLPGPLEYAVKFICGKSGTDGCHGGAPVAPGHYYTAINVHNPSQETVVIRWKVAVALPGAEAGPVSTFSQAKLRHDEAMEIDCADIRCLAHRRDPFLKGFVVIQTDGVDLDVVAVYTAAGADHHVETLHTERVRPRVLRPTPTGMPDLVPLPDPRKGFCNFDAQGGLFVIVKNQGTGPAPASHTRVEFAPGGQVTLPTIPLAAGQQVMLGPITVPPQCYDPECDFRIIVDVFTAVAELDEGNNTATGKCRRG